MEKKKKKHKSLRIVYLICAIIVIIAGIYYENGYTDVNTFISDIKNKAEEIFLNKGENIAGKGQKNTVPTSTKVYKKVNGKLEMHVIDIGQRR